MISAVEVYQSTAMLCRNYRDDLKGELTLQSVTIILKEKNVRDFNDSRYVKKSQAFFYRSGIVELQVHPKICAASFVQTDYCNICVHQS